MTFTPDLPSTEEVLGHIFESSVPPVPPQEQHIGKTLVSWWETDPGEVYIHAEGGTPDDRHYATTLVDLQLQPHGYRRASFDMDASAAPEPPNYRMATGKDHCGGCKMFNAKGQCWGYGNKKVKAKAVCDSFAPEIKAKAAALHREPSRITMAGIDTPRDIGDYITTQEGYTFEVVDMADNSVTGIPEYIVRSDLDGNDMARSEGSEGADWQYVYIPANEVVN